MSRVLLLGLGGLDADLLRVYGPFLPNLRNLMLESPFLELKSTIPPEPLPAWASVYAGRNPANHGLLEQMDCLERNVPECDTLQPFWERAAQAGKRVCVINPLLRGTEQKVDGLTMVTGTPGKKCACHTHGQYGEREQTQKFPPLLDEPLIPHFSQLTAFANLLRERTEQQVQMALQMYRREEWDLFVVQFDTLDHIEHFLWRYSDPGDPMYPGKNDHSSRILDFYRYFDEIVGRFLKAKDGETALVIVSGHGHERRCVYRLHINEWLRLRNLLTPEKQNGAPGERVDKQASWWARLGQHLHLFSHNQAVPGVDTVNSLAYLVELASASPFGGIAINQEQLAREDEKPEYEQMRTEILLGLEQLRINESPVVMWAKRREDCYEGDFLTSYPDILFELRSDFGVDRSLYTSLVVPDATHRLVSGAHSAHGVLLLENCPTTLEVIEGIPVPNVVDVAPTVLRMLEVEEWEEGEEVGIDGVSLVSVPKVKQLI